MQSEPLRQFSTSWKFVRSMSVEFIDAVPPQHWMTTPHPDYAPLAKQVRHMVWVAGLYNNALVHRKLNLASKKQCYAGGLEKAELLAALAQQDLILQSFLSGLTATDGDAYVMDFFTSKFGLYEFLHNMIQHEAMHHGMWALYAKLAGFSTPESWRNNWEL